MSQKIQIVSPGRVNLLGEHVDKNDGKVLPAAIDRSIKLSAEVRDDSLLKIKALDLSESVEIDLRKLDAKLDSAGRPLPSWAKYPAGVAWGLQSGGFATRGAEVEFTSNIPMGAGLSSSAAVEVAFAVLWQSMSGWAMDRLTLSQYCQKAEVEYAGGLLVLDHSQYCGKEDYELEYEVTDEVVGKEAFFTLLKERAIPIRPADKKIARFMAAAQ
ncbi:MAG: hypothetical protein CVU45_06280, partial [Chloroflexi bacterium HGW-Chloroflexi-7]